MKKLKVIITLDMKCPDDLHFKSLKESSKDVLNVIASDTMLVPWDQGYRGKIAVRVESGKDYFTSWCLLEEIKEMADKMNIGE